jgi:histidinol-phosphate aminotransferase
MAALADEDYVTESARLNRDGLVQLMTGLDAIGVAYLPSHGNFLMVRVADAGKGAAPVYEGLLRSGVIVRPVANYGLPEWIRVTVGLPEENARFLSALGAVLGR